MKAMENINFLTFLFNFLTDLCHIYNSEYMDPNISPSSLQKSDVWHSLLHVQKRRREYQGHDQRNFPTPLRHWNQNCICQESCGWVNQKSPRPYQYHLKLNINSKCQWRMLLYLTNHKMKTPILIYCHLLLMSRMKSYPMKTSF